MTFFFIFQLCINCISEFISLLFLRIFSLICRSCIETILDCVSVIGAIFLRLDFGDVDFREDLKDLCGRAFSLKIK
jgi:hypothetical protein